MPHKACSEIPSMDSVVFNRAGVEHLLKNLDSKKVNDPDKLPTTLLKITASEIGVTFLFNQSYDSGELPEDWRNAHVVPIFKKGACKLMEHVVYKDIMNHLENYDILSANPGGGTPLYGLYRYVRPQRVWFFSPFSHKLGIDFSHFAAILVINRVSIFVLSSSIRFFLEEATSSSRPPSPIRALPSSTPLNACHAC